MYFESRGSADIPTVICSAVSSDILHWTFGIRTVFAVLGSYGSQLILKGDFLGMLNVTPIPQPWSYVILFGVSCPAMWLSAVLVQMAQVPPVPGEDSESPAGLQWKEILSGLKSFFLNPLIMAAAVGFQLTYNGAMVMNTISLYARETLGEAPEKGAGIQLALQPGFRWLMGFGSGIIPTLLGLVSDRYSLRASFVAAIGILVLALILVQTRLPKQPTVF
jgi:hypothetical protein